MRLEAKLARLILFLMCVVRLLTAQDLRPRAYVIVPTGSNAVILSYAFNDGSIFVGSVLPISDASGQYHVPAITYYRAFSFFRRSATIAATLPYVVGTFQGEVGQTHQQIYRSGLADTIFRFSVNLIGGPAMPLSTFARWKQKTLLGVSLQVVAPTGQYYPSHLINPGDNRWAVRPEIGFSQRWRNLLFDAYSAVWLFTANNNYLTGSEFSKNRNVLTQAPIGAVEMHLSYNVKPRLWASLDGNYWYGGTTTVNGAIKIGTLQANSRIGGTVSLPFNRHQAVKFSYSDGELVRVGGTFKTVSVAWQYSWIGKAR